MPKPISSDQREEILAGLDFGATNRQIADETGVSKATIQKIRNVQDVSIADPLTTHDRLEREIVAVCGTTWDFRDVVESFEDDLSYPQILKAAKIAGNIRTDSEISAQEQKEIYRLIKERQSLEDISLRYNNLSISAIGEVREGYTRRKADIQKRWDKRKINRRNAKIIEALRAGENVQQIVAQFNDTQQRVFGTLSEVIVRRVAKGNDFTITKTKTPSPEEIRSAETDLVVIRHLKNIQHEILTGEQTGEIRPQATATATYQALADSFNISIGKVLKVVRQNNLRIIFLPATLEEAELAEAEKIIGSAHRGLADKFEISVAELAELARWGRRLEDLKPDGLPGEGYLFGYTKDPEQRERARQKEEKERTVIRALRGLADELGISTATQARIIGREARRVAEGDKPVLASRQTEAELAAAKKRKEIVADLLDLAKKHDIPLADVAAIAGTEAGLGGGSIGAKTKHAAIKLASTNETASEPGRPPGPYPVQEVVGNSCDI